MPSSTSSNPTPSLQLFGTAAPRTQHASTTAHFHVVPFRRDANGAIVPGAVMDAPNGDIAWRRARAAAFDHDNVGAIELRDGVLLARFGEVNLDLLAN